MQFSDLEAFFAMGGHGLYVWLAYGIGFVVFLVAAINPVLQKKRIIKELKQLQRRQNQHSLFNESKELH